MLTVSRTRFNSAIQPLRNCRLARVAALVAVLVFAQRGLAWQPAPPAVAPIVDLDAQPDRSPAETPSPEAPDAAAEATEQSDVQAASFKEVTPGQSSIAETIRALGEPKRRDEQDGMTRMLYLIEPFYKVDVYAADGVVSSIAIHLREPSQSGDLEKELGLTKFQPAAVRDERGQLLGQVYPERGIMFGFADDEAAGKVAHIVLETITAEPFILRAAERRFVAYEQSIRDLWTAHKYDAADERIYWLEAEILADAGQLSTALEAVDESIRRTGGGPPQQLLRARLLSELNRHGQAVQVVKEILADDKATPIAKARAEQMLGDLSAAGPKRDFKEATEHHLAAIKLATKLAESEVSTVRREAKRVLFDAHLALASDIAWGRWRRKDEVVPKWLQQAEGIADDLVEHEGAEALIRWQLARGKLAALAGISSDVDPTAAIPHLAKPAQQLVDEAADPLVRARLELLLGETLFHAARIYHVRQQPEDAIAVARQSVKLIESAGKTRETTPSHNYLLGRLYFLFGSIYAVAKNDHRQAVVWFEKSVQRLQEDLPVAAEAEKGFRGEWYVSMGVSYWKSGARERAVQLTKHGVSLIEQASEEGTIPASALAVPYGNLAAMLRQLGQDEEAQEYSDRAKRHQTARQQPAAGETPR